MKSLQVKNIHCLNDTGLIPLKGINLFVGANSSGKSSLLRMFPLLRQSLDPNKKGPLLWYGNLVDFGSFEDAHRHGTNNVSFSFGVSLNFDTFFFKDPSEFQESILSFVVDSVAKNDYLRSFSMKSSLLSLEMDFTSGGNLKRFVINNHDFSQFSNRLQVYPARFIPQVRFVSSVKKRKDKKQFPVTKSDFLKAALKSYPLSFSIDEKKVLEMLSTVSYSSLNNILPELKERFYSITSSWNLDSPEFIEFFDYLLLYRIETLLFQLDHSISEALNNIYYLGPYRAAVERYYRIQNVAVKEIDPHGDNMPMYIGNLNPVDLKSLQNWMRNNFDFYVEPEFSKGHLSLFLVDSSDKFHYNLIDRGYGFSQLLPILVMLWHIQEKNQTESYSDSMVLSIEQPELHLHPKLLRKLTSAFVTCTRLLRINGIDFNLILETHSPTIINTLGECVYKKEFDKDDITIALFNDIHNKDNHNQVELVTFDENGVLTNWPIGFLD